MQSRSAFRSEFQKFIPDTKTCICCGSSRISPISHFIPFHSLRPTCCVFFSSFLVLLTYFWFLLICFVFSLFELKSNVIHGLITNMMMVFLCCLCFCFVCALFALKVCCLKMEKKKTYNNKPANRSKYEFVVSE